MTEFGSLTDAVLELRYGGGEPGAWLADFVTARLDDWGEEPGSVARTVSLPELLADDAAMLRAQFATLVGDGTPSQAAATYLAGWFGGGLAEAVGIGLAGAGAGFCADADRIEFDLHADGWPIRIRPGGPTVVTDGHPWAGAPDVIVVASPDGVVDRTIHTLVAVATPIVAACRALTAVGTAGLWNEVGDSLGGVVAYQRLLPADAEVFALLETAMAWPGVPWKGRARLGVAQSEELGPVAVIQKGGCCLAYTGDHADDELPIEGVAVDISPEQQAWIERFPADLGAPRYCSTCAFREADDCDARQVFWLERLAQRTAS